MTQARSGMMWLRLFSLLTGTALHAQTQEVRLDLKKYFDSAGVHGSFSLYDVNENKFILSHPRQFTEQFPPASTFKICNSLIGLETGVIPHENYVIQWDSVRRDVEAWNRDCDLMSAFRNSVVWYYQELARRVGGKRMKLLLDALGYGNADTSGGIDLFWLTGGLRVSPAQQLTFLLRLYKDELPVSQRSRDIVKRIMIEESTPRYTLRSKTGLAEMEGTGSRSLESVGWYVGYVTRADNVFFFSTCIQRRNPNPRFREMRKTITRSILKKLDILP